MKKILFVLAFLILLISACTSKREKDETELEAIINEEQPAELTVYVAGDRVRGQMDGEKVHYYITFYSIGPFGPLTNAPREHGHMFYEAFQRFEQETGIKVNIEYFYSMDLMEEQILKDKQEGQGPDLIISDHKGWSTAREHNNIYRLIYNDWFVDMMPYLEMDEVYESGEYYNEVLQAGILGDEQYVLPLSFNINGLFASVEDMNELGVAIEDGMGSRQLLEQLTRACEMADEDELVVENLSLGIDPTSFVQDYWESTGFPVVDYAENIVMVDQATFEDVAVCFKEYLKMTIKEDWETVEENALQYMEDPYWDANIVPGNLDTLDEDKNWSYMMEESGLEWMNQGIFFYEMGSRSFDAHSLPGQCMALSSLYDDLDEQMVMVSVPMYESNQYMAQVKWYGGVTTDSESPYHSYQLLKYLLDQEYDPYYAIPVEKENAEKMLDTLSESVYTLHLWLGAAWDYDVDFSKEIETYDVQPLPEDLKQQLQYMLDNIGGATLPQASVYIPLVFHMEAYALGLEKLEEAYENTCADLEKHLEYIKAGDSRMDFALEGYTLSSLSESKEQSLADADNKDVDTGADEDDTNTIRWGVFGQYEVADADKTELVDRLRNALVNAALKEKGYDLNLEVIFVEMETGDQLEAALAYEEPFDIITFNAAGIGSQDMQEHLLPLEEYMQEGGVLHEVYQLYSDQIWLANQVDGHNYNLGQLTGAASPVYWFSDANYESEPQWPADMILNGDEEEIAAYLEENAEFFLLSEPYLWGKDDEVFAGYQFHMVAPGVGLNIENGTQFENIWTSEYATERLEQEKQWIQEGVADSHNGSLDHNILVYRCVDTLNNMYTTTTKDFYLQYFPITSQTRMVPQMQQCYTSILKDSEKVEECLTLLSILNTDAELCESLYKESAASGGENSTGEFVYICNYYIATEEADGAKIQSDRVAALTEDQISPILGFVFDRTPVEAEVQALESIKAEQDLFASENEWVWELMEVRDDPKKYAELLEKYWQQNIDEYLQKLQDAGIDKVIDEANRQLEQWRVENQN